MHQSTTIQIGQNTAVKENDGKQQINRSQYQSLPQSRQQTHQVPKNVSKYVWNTNLQNPKKTQKNTKKNTKKHKTFLIKNMNLKGEFIVMMYFIWIQ